MSLILNLKNVPIIKYKEAAETYLEHTKNENIGYSKHVVDCENCSYNGGKSCFEEEKYMNGDISCAIERYTHEWLGEAKIVEIDVIE